MLLNTISDYKESLKKFNPKSIGLVPTMGALHEGHMSLIKKAQQDCDCVVVSIFVNPTQFNNPNDLSNYPRTIAQDLQSIEELSKDILVYIPKVDEIYPKGINSKKFDFGELSRYMEGEYREGHFNGVGTVLEKLFDLLKPDKAYFGEKDFQQLAVVRKLVKLTQQPVKVIGCKTYRESNGLAKSSRNKLLTEQEKEDAGIIFEQLNLVKNNFGIMKVSDIKKRVKQTFNASGNFKLEYIEIASEEELVPVEHIETDKKYRAFIAVYCNSVRLIDNMALN